MSLPQNRKKLKIALARMEIVAQLYKRGYSFRKIQEEVVARLNLETYSLSTVKKDVDKLLAEWRQNRLSDMDDAVQLELERIDDTVQELWDQWERSKTNVKKIAKKKKGSPVANKVVDGSGALNSRSEIKTYQLEETETEVIMLGDVSYISEIRAQLIERRKLIGMYAPEKKDITGDMSFMGFLMESGALDDAENEDAKD